VERQWEKQVTATKDHKGRKDADGWDAWDGWEIANSQLQIANGGDRARKIFQFCVDRWRER
jgi:hypothetical protein